MIQIFEFAQAYIFLIRKITQLLYLNSNFINRRFFILTNIRIVGFKFKLFYLIQKETKFNSIISDNQVNIIIVNNNYFKHFLC